MTTDFNFRAQCLKLLAAGFLIFVIVFVSRDFEVGNKYESTASPVRG